MSGYESDTCGRSYTIRIRYAWTQIFLYPHKKNLRIQKSPDTCGRGLRKSFVGGSNRLSLKRIVDYYGSFTDVCLGFTSLVQDLLSLAQGATKSKQKNSQKLRF